MAKRTATLLLAILMLLSVIGAPVFAEGEVTVTDGAISFDFNAVTGGIVNRKSTATVTKNVEFEGKTAVKFVPTPDTDEAATNPIILDCWSLANYTDKVEVPKYKYVGVTYYYATGNPSYSGSLKFSILPGNTGAASGTIYSTEEIVTNAWTEAIFPFGTSVGINESAEKKYINQVHFYPFGETKASNVTADDVIYVAAYTFYENNPGPTVTYTASFYAADPDATGTAPETIEYVLGDTYTLPANPFTLENGTFLGWKSSYDGELYDPGDEITAVEGNVYYSAVWSEQVVYPDYLYLDFTKYANGIVNKHDTASVYSASELDGIPAMKLVPNPSATMNTLLTLDGWSYAAVNADFDVYKWIAVMYKYESANPINTNMRIEIMANGGILTGGFGNFSTENIVEGKWAIALFDMTGIDAKLAPDVSHVLRQMHIRPFGNTNVNTLSADDTMYISSVMFFKNEPDLTVHEAFIDSENGNFNENGTVTRGEACRMITHLLEGSDISSAAAPTFTDVAANHKYAKYIGYCEDKGILSSYEGTFSPDSAITRAEFAELVFNTEIKEASFADVPKNHPKYAAIAAMAGKPIFTTTGGSFRPDESITRLDAILAINRARGRDMADTAFTPDFIAVYLDVDNAHAEFANISEASVTHIENNGEWLCACIDPIERLGDLYTPDLAPGNAKVAQIDTLAARRKSEILSAASDLSTITKKTYYVSPNGDDSNDGRTEATAWKTISKVADAALDKGDGVLFQRGATFRGKFTVKPGVTYSAYGTGDKPKIYGSPENGADASKWTLYHENTETGAKIWKYANEDMTDVGNIVFDGEIYGYKEVPSYVNGKFVVRTAPGTDFDIATHLDRNLKFFHKADSVISGGIPSIGTAKGPLYLRCDDGNPGSLFNDIEFSTRGNVISVGQNRGVTIDNLCIMYGGSHGVGAGTTEDLTVKNSVFGWIGGSVQYYNADSGSVVRFGNGVEIYGGCKNYTVENCYIYQNYDAGVTHQHGGNTGNISMYNVTYRDNLIEDCVYSIEYFHGAPASGTAVRDGKDILIENNILRRAGYGFGSTRPDGYCQVHIKSWDHRNEFINFVIRDNIFDRSVWNLLHISATYKAWLPRFENNTYIQGYGNEFVRYGKGGSKPYKFGVKAENTMETVLKDTDGTIYYVENIPYYTFPYGE